MGLAKNNKLIEQYKTMYKKIQQITPEVYAAIALALHRKNKWGYKRINELFEESQKIWQESVNEDKDMVQMCMDETGIELRNK